MFTIRYNRTTNHIDGIAERSKGSALNYAVTACPVLSRSFNLATGKGYEDLKKALQAARKTGGRKLCKKCEAAALATLEATKKAEAPKVEKAEEKPAKRPGKAPANFVDLARTGNTEAARRYWARIVAEYEG
jgi:hypothetical protein